jgi:hypothetical protein
MGQPQEKPTVTQLLKLADQLTPEEQEELLGKLQLKELRREIQLGIDASNRGEVVSLEELNQRLDAKHAEILERQKK